MTSAGGWVRNGDRWTVTHRHPDGSLTVSRLGGHGRVVLPAAYVAADVALAYALTVHKAQGVTVDRAVLVADDATTAEALYVGMTRGRHHNTALVVCDSLDPNHHDTAPTAAEILVAALGRVSAEQAPSTCCARRSPHRSRSPRSHQARQPQRLDPPGNPARLVAGATAAGRPPRPPRAPRPPRRAHPSRP
jgi:hypothetical protein